MRSGGLLSFFYRHTTLGLAIAFLILLGIIWLKPDWFFQPAINVQLTEATTPPAVTSQGTATSYAGAVKAAAPSVVNIYSTKVITQRLPLFQDPVIQQYFGNLAVPRQRMERSLGSGVIISPQGYLLTNNHVIEGASEILVALHDNRTATARLIGSDPDTDLAVLRINLPDIPAITLGNSEALQIGDVVLAIGNPFGVGQTVTHGIVSATGRTDLGINTFENFIQTDAAINPGNSGGALINSYGQLVGINTAIFSRSGGSQGIGFAIPTSLVKQVLEQIIQHGHVIRGWLGLETQDITPMLAQSFGLGKTQGVIVAGILRGGPADQAGLQPGDIITHIDNQPVTDSKQSMTRIVQAPPGTRISLKLWRNGQSVDATVVVQQRPS